MKKLLSAFVVMACLLFLAACDDDCCGTEFDEQNISLISYFRAAHPDQEIVTVLEEDFNNDGIIDLVVVYRESPLINHKVTVYSGENGFNLTQPVLVTAGDIELDWREIGESNPQGLYISGTKGAQFCIRVMSFVDEEWVYLFGGGMCC